MKQNFEIELDDYFNESDMDLLESHVQSHRRRRAHDARRQLEDIMEQRKLRRMLDHFNDGHSDH